MTRRTAILASIAGMVSGAEVPNALKPAHPHIGIMDGILGYPSQPEALKAAASLGFEGVQVTIGKPNSQGRLPLSDAGLQRRFREAAAQYRIILPSTYLDVLHVNCLKNDPLAMRWIREGITITKALNAKILMLVFFGKCALDSRADADAVIAPLKEACKWAEDDGIILGFENTISAEENARVLDAVHSPALKVWYDVGNSTNIGHFDVPKEIRFLGRDRICEFHIKDKTYLGEGAVKVQACLEAIGDIRFEGFLVLETATPTGNRLNDAAKNLAILRSMMASVRR
jgi:sugar phosphate isomerase/epimerase